MRTLIVVTSTALIWACIDSPASAWNSIGHMAVGRLAFDRLDDSAKTRLFTLLKSHPHFQEFLAAGRPEDVSEVEWVILRTGVWPDWVRPRDKERRVNVTQFHRGEEHYINIPYIDPGDIEAFAGKILVNPDSTNIVCALKQRCNDLQTRTAAAQDRAVAACWIVHLIGDIHQPLHNVSYFSNARPFLQGDQGGNKFGIKVNGRKWKLHTYWDNLLGDDGDYTDDSPQRQARLYQQATAIAERLRSLQLPDADLSKLATSTTFESWSQEGFELAKTIAYQKSDGTGVLPGVEVKFKEPVPDSAPEVGGKYDQTARAIAELRVVLAGRRLATRLQKLLADN